jgi:hypothetical protein
MNKTTLSVYDESKNIDILSGSSLSSNFPLNKVNMTVSPALNYNVVHVIAQAGDCNGMKKLIDNGVDLSVKNVFGQTPKDIAIVYHNKEMLELFENENLKLLQINNDLIKDKYNVASTELYNEKIAHSQTIEQKSKLVREKRTIESTNTTLTLQLANEQSHHMLTRSRVTKLESENSNLRYQRKEFDSALNENVQLNKRMRTLEYENNNLTTENTQVKKERDTYKTRYETLKNSK